MSGISKCDSGSNQRSINSLRDLLQQRDAKTQLEKKIADNHRKSEVVSLQAEIAAPSMAFVVVLQQ